MHKIHKDSKIHNIAFVGKDSVGKSKLIDSLLRMQSKSKEKLIVELEGEKARNYTICNHYYHLDRGENFYNLIDTPGNTNFLPKVNIALSVSTGCVFTVSGEGGNESSFRIWQRIIERETPRVLFINGMDQPDANFENTLHDVEQTFSVKPVVLQVPWIKEGKLEGIIDILEQKLITGPTGMQSITEVPEELMDEVEIYRATTIESLSEIDDDLMEYFIEEKEPPMDLLKSALEQGVTNLKLTPVLTGSAKQQIGLESLSEFINTYFHSHQERAPWLAKTSADPDADYVEVLPKPDQKFSGIVFKTLHDRYSGKLSFILVVSGTLKKGDKLLNSTAGTKFQCGRISFINGVSIDEVEEAYPGDIVVVEKEDAIATNQSICDIDEHVVFEPIPFLKARCTSRLELTNSSKDNRTIDALHKVVAEDPSLRLHKNEGTNELLLSGMGLMHLEVVKEQLKSVYDVEISLGQPQIAYLETIRKPVTVQGKHKKQSGGHGQYGDVHLKVEPQPRGSGFEFVNKIVGGVIPKTYIPSVEKGVKEALVTGSLAGYPVVDVKVTLLDGSYHAVDSSDFAFQAAGILAIKKALPEAKSVLLEPIMEVEIDIPEGDVGKVTKDINIRRGRVNQYYSKELTSVINADIPLSELIDYTPSLRGLTQGMGLYTMSLKGHEPLTSHLSAKVIAARSKEKG